LPALIFGCWPWGGWLVFLRGKAWFSGWAACFSRGNNPSVTLGAAWAARLRNWSLEKRWAVLAVGLPITVFFLSRSKLPLYVLPLFGPLAVLVAVGLLRAFERDAARLWKWATLLAVSVWMLSVVVKGVLPLFPSDRDAKTLHALMVSHVKDVPMDRLAVFETKRMNGLQFYLQGEVQYFDSKDTPEFQQWLKSGGAGEKYVLLRPGHTNTLKTCVAPAQAELVPLTGKWTLARIPRAP
jgi:4-amino-4-deoxy-L-arabinose transferase